MMVCSHSQASPHVLPYGQVMALTPTLDLPSEVLVTPGLPHAAPSMRPSQTGRKLPVQLWSYCEKYIATPSRAAPRTCPQRRMRHVQNQVLLLHHLFLLGHFVLSVSHFIEG